MEDLKTWLGQFKLSDALAFARVVNDICYECPLPMNSTNDFCKKCPLHKFNMECYKIIYEPNK